MTTPLIPHDWAAIDAEAEARVEAKCAASQARRDRNWHTVVARALADEED